MRQLRVQSLAPVTLFVRTLAARHPLSLPLSPPETVMRIARHVRAITTSGAYSYHRNPWTSRSSLSAAVRGIGAHPSSLIGQQPGSDTGGAVGGARARRREGTGDVEKFRRGNWEMAAIYLDGQRVAGRVARNGRRLTERGSTPSGRGFVVRRFIDLYRV